MEAKNETPTKAKPAAVPENSVLEEGEGEGEGGEAKAAEAVENAETASEEEEEEDTGAAPKVKKSGFLKRAITSVCVPSDMVTIAPCCCITHDADRLN